MDEGIVIPLAGMVMVLCIVLGLPLVRVWTRRMEARSAPPLARETEARLERIEQAVDAMAIEIERMSEGQRFTTKLLADRLGEGAALPRGDAHNGRTPGGR